MKTLLAILAAITFGGDLNAANLTIAKAIRIDMGGKSYPLGAPTNRFDGAYPLRDGGYLVVGEGYKGAWQRFTPTGASVWSNRFELEGRPSALAELQDGRLAFLAHPATGGLLYNSLFTIGSDGSGFTPYPLPQLGSQAGSPDADYTTLLAQTDGLLVGGLGVVAGNSTNACFIMSFSTNFDKVWQRDYTSITLARASLTRYDCGYILASGSPSSGPVYSFAAVSTNGVVLWQTAIPYTGWDENLNVLPCSDGGVLIGFSPTASIMGAPFYGTVDICLIKLDSGGNVVWIRSFGGVGFETLGSVQQTEDGGFLVAGWTRLSQVSGNKAVDGDGVWLLKLTPDGFKERTPRTNTRIAPLNRQKVPLLICNDLHVRFLGSEAVIQSGLFDGAMALLPAPDGYRLAAASWILDLTVRRVIDITATSTGRPFRLDYSYNLLDWTNIVSRYNATINLEEDMEPGNKFYRRAEIP